MAEFKRKNNNNFWHSPLMLLVIFVVLILFIYNTIGLFEKERETTKKKDLVLSQIETLRNREASLTNDINKLKTDEGVEETIRDKFQVVKQGEKMVIITDDENQNQTVGENKTSDHSFWGWVKKTFKL